MHTEDLPYVVATGEVTVWLNESNPHSIKSINQLIDDLARKLPEQVAVGMPAPSGDSWVCQNLSEPSAKTSHYVLILAKPTESCTRLPTL